jgi:hypothetical protein
MELIVEVTGGEQRKSVVAIYQQQGVYRNLVGEFLTVNQP